MKILFVDNETSDVKQEKKRNPSPYLPENFLVSVGWQLYPVETEVTYEFFQHNEKTATQSEKDTLQRALSEADLFVAFNAKFDLAWLLECGFKYEGKIYDPFIVEYIIARGQKLDISLAGSLKRRGLAGKSDVCQVHWDNGLSYHEMPIEDVREYGTQDVVSLRELYFKQQELLALPENVGLWPTIDMSNEFIWSLIDMERNGIAIDRDALDAVAKEFQAEYNKLNHDLEALAASVMGDTPCNLDSPEQLSQLVYSRKVIDKHRWADIFNIGTELRGSVLKPKRRPYMSHTEFVKHVRSNTQVLRRTQASHCHLCTRGLVYKQRIDGTPFKKPSKCGTCGGLGYVLVDLSQVAGFKCSPSGPNDVASGGFKTDGDSIERLRLQATGPASEFLSKISRRNALSTYLDTFVAGIVRGTGVDGLLHTQLMQAITSTGRLSSQQPNFQNMPRAGTFPIRRVVKSRWEGGEVLEVDFAKLEYATAVFLAGDKVGLEDILNGVDAHALTASIIECNRQDAKPHTFKPLYGGSSGTPNEKKYYEWFKEKHKGIAKWQDDNKSECIRFGKLRIPSGREYVFRDTKRLPSGWVTNSTQICNYPVQGFATADIVPVTIIELRKALNYGRDHQSLRSLIVLTVHDSIVFDIYPGEREAIIDLINSVFSRVPEILNARYGIKLNVPLGWETKAGPDWLNMKGVYVDDGLKYYYKEAA